MSVNDTVEHGRLAANQQQKGGWGSWGPYLSERAWGTVREDYSANGDAWGYFPHDHARSRAYRWSEDGLGGICDSHQDLCFALALWNGQDPFLKERAFGLAGGEGNHGEDVKDYYFYLDNTPSHSYMKYLYKYPQAAFPYAQLLAENRRRGKDEPEFELVDTGIFDEGRYFDVAVEYAKAAPEDILIRIRISNRGPDAAHLDVLPTLWFRNTWSWGHDTERPVLGRGSVVEPHPSVSAVVARHALLGNYVLYCAGADELLFTENETNTTRLYGSPPATPYVKDAFHRYVVAGELDAVNPEHDGTKAAARYHLTVGAGETVTLELRLMEALDGATPEEPFADFDAVFAARIAEANAYYAGLLPEILADDARLVARQAFAGLLWSKQYYHYVVKDWLDGDPAGPPPPTARRGGRNHSWGHLYNQDVISMPDKWEFPWYASWDLGFHCVALSYVDPQFAKDQILLMLREWYMHPNGQLPAYEWDFGDVNPPILPLAARVVFEIDRVRNGRPDYDFLTRVFHKAVLNFTWWVNRKDELGNNVFQGGFLGMDNIGAFDRNTLPDGYLLGQADGTSWMAAFAKNLMSLALILAEKDPAYEDMASKFWDHYLAIANSVNSVQDAEASLWDEADGFFYDWLIAPDGQRSPVRGRTMVGFVPLFGAQTVAADTFDRFPGFAHRRQWVIDNRPDLVESVRPMVEPGPAGRLMLGLVRPEQLERLLAYMLDEDEFLSPHGIRSVSRHHADEPLVLQLGGQEFRLDYEPGESTSDLFGGNSNWRGPIWLPVNRMVLLALEQYHLYYGEDYRVECPVGSGRMLTLHEVELEVARRLASIFLRGEDGRRPVFGDCALFNQDPHWRDLIPFHEYFHGDSGRGCGASHQTGWTGLIAEIMIRYKDFAAADVRPYSLDIG